MTDRTSFPILQNHPDVIYFDNGSTSLKPDSVLTKMTEYYTDYTANTARGNYKWAERVNKEIEQSRQHVADFLHVPSSAIVFTSGATDSVAMITQAYALQTLEDGDEIVLCLEDHQSTILPWLQLQKTLAHFNKTITIKTIELTDYGDYNSQSLKDALSDRTKMLVLTHIHNVHGIIMETAQTRELAGEKVIIALDISQSVGHIPLDLTEMGVDFAYFSGHKMFADTGIGVLYVHPRMVEHLLPYRVGGGSNLTARAKTAHELLEAGTPHIAGIISLNAAIAFIQTVGIETIQKKLEELTQYAIAQLKTIDDVTFLPGFATCMCYGGYGIISFRIKGIDSYDIGMALQERNIFVRTGSHCMGNDTKEDSIRISMHFYNTTEEIDAFIAQLRDILLSYS